MPIISVMTMSPMDELNMAAVGFDAHLPVSTPESEIVQTDDITITTTAEVFLTITIPVRIGPNKCSALCCKVDISADINFKPLCMFQKLFWGWINVHSCQTACVPFWQATPPIMAHKYPNLWPIIAKSSGPHWMLKHHTPCPHLAAHCRCPSSTILGLPNHAKLKLVQMNCAIKFICITKP